MPEGRDLAVGQIKQAIGRGSGSFVVVGDAGIGKSTLLAEVIDHALTHGMRVLGTRWSGDPDSPAMWPWSVLVRNWITEVGSLDALGEVHPLIRRLVPDLAEGRFAIPDAPADEMSGRLALGDGLGRLVARSSKPVLVVLEDLHHAPPGGLGLLEPFASAALTGKVVIAASSRDLASAAGLTAHPSTLRVELQPFTDAEATDFVRNLDPDLDRATVADVVLRAEGNPFFLAELTRLAATSDATETTTPAVRDVVLRRVDGLRDGAREVLAIAALLGRKPKIDLLYAIVEDDELTDAVLDDAERARLLDIEGKSLRWNHDLVRESLTESLRSQARRRLHRRISDALGRTGSADVFQRAHHALAAGDAEPGAADLGERAATAAADSGAHEEAVRWVDDTLAIVSDLPDAEARLLRLQFIAGRSMVALQMYEEGRQRLVESARLALADGDGPAAATALMTIGAERLRGAEVYEPPRELLEHATQLLRGDPYWTCRLIGRMSDLVHDRTEAERLADEAADLARASGDPNLLVTALGRLLISFRDTRLEHHESIMREIELAAPRAALEQQFEAQAFACVVHLLHGDIEAAAALIPPINAAILRIGVPRALGFHTTAGAIHMLQGRFDRAQDEMQAHVDATQGAATIEALGAQGATNGYIAILRGDFSGFLETATMFLTITEGTPSSIRVHAFVALAAQLAGDHDTARRSIDEAFRIGFDNAMAWSFGLGTSLVMLVAEALSGYGDDRVFELEQYLLPFSGYMPAGGMAPMLLFGAADHQLALINRQRGDTEGARQRIDAAIALHRRMGADPFTARSLLVSAEIAEDDGDLARAIADAREAAHLARRYEMRQVGEKAAGLLARQGAAPVKGTQAPGPAAALVFTDIESSTASAAALGDEVWSQRRRDHDATVRRLVSHHGGREVKHLGDGFMLTFPTAHSAVDFGVALQRAFTDASLRVRAGVHVGPVIEEDGDLFGTTVNVAARVSSAAKGGETLLSEETLALVVEARVGEPRVAELKGVPQPMKLYPLTP